MFLRSKKQRQGIMVLEFIFSFEHLNLASLTLQEKQEAIEKTSLTYTEAVELFH